MQWAAGLYNAVGKRNRILQIVQFNNALLSVVTICPVTKSTRVPGTVVPFGFRLVYPFSYGFTHCRRVSYTYLDTEQLSGADQGKELRNAPTHHLGLDAVYKFGNWTIMPNPFKSFTDVKNNNKCSPHLLVIIYIF